MTELDDFRADKDAFFRNDRNSPLTPEQQRDFRGLRYYPERPDLALTLRPEPLDHPETVEMQTSTGHIAWYTQWARLHFEVEGQPAELTVYRDPTMGLLFLPFQDANAGGDTYGAGRYLEPHPLDDGRLLVDFNYAYNPYCAYNEQWTCPIPPAENRLVVAIEAGEMSWDGEH
jgi:uncharacterized protein (DUF1684 family)